MIKLGLVAFTACVIIASGTQANAVSLRTSIIVAGKYLTLGDLFGISGEQASTPVAHAPKWFVMSVGMERHRAQSKLNRGLV